MQPGEQVGALAIGISVRVCRQLGWLLRETKKDLLHHVLVSAGLSEQSARMAQERRLMTMNQSLKGSGIALSRESQELSV